MGDVYLEPFKKECAPPKKVIQKRILKQYSSPAVSLSVNRFQQLSGGFMKSIITILSFLFFTSAIALGDNSVKSLELQSNGIDILEIECGAGFLKVTGVENLDKIEVKAEINVDIRNAEDREDFIQHRVKLSIEQRGSRAILISEIKNSSFFGRNARIDLTVRMPKNMDLNIEDGSGLMEIRDIAGDLMIDDGSGGMELENITGKVEIDDGSGEIDMRNITGNAEVDDGSGGIEIERVNGDLYIDDGSGSMRISEITGNVVVRDGSGSIHIDRVDKDVEIKEAGSGGVHIENVKGRVTKRD